MDALETDTVGFIKRPTCHRCAAATVSESLPGGLHNALKPFNKSTKLHSSSSLKLSGKYISTREEMKPSDWKVSRVKNKGFPF